MHADPFLGLSLEAHILTPASGICWSWSGGEGVELAELAYTLPLFCWPPALWLERPTPHAFATTTSSGTRRFGFVIGWVETLSASAGDALALVLLASTPIEWLYFEVLQLAHERIAGATGAAGVGRLPAVADARVAPLLEALLRTLREQRSLCLSLASAGRESALAMLCRTLRPTGLLNALLSLLSEERVLLVGSDPLMLFRAAEALASALAPLDFCGALVPILPDGLHPEAPTLLNEAVEPYIVGLHTVHHAKLKPELDNDEILTIDLDTATLSGAPVATKRRAQWLRLPAVVETSRLLLQAVGGGNDALSTISGSLKGVGDSLSGPFGAGGPFSSFGAGARPSETKGDSHKGDSHKGHRRSASAEDSTAAPSVEESTAAGGACSQEEEEDEDAEEEKRGACKSAVRTLIAKLISLEHSPLKTSSTASDRTSWERMTAMAVLATALHTLMTSDDL